MVSETRLIFFFRNVFRQREYLTKIKQRDFLTVQAMHLALQQDKRLYLTLRVLMSYIYGAPILDVSRSHTTTNHSL